MAGWTQEQLDALLVAMANGTKKVEYADKKVEYNSYDEMLALKNAMENCLGLGELPADYKGGRRIGCYYKN